MPENPTDKILEVAKQDIGPLPAWQWGAIVGVGIIAARMLLPAVPGGSFFRRSSGGQSTSATVIGGGVDRRPVAPSAGLPPGPVGGAAFQDPSSIMPGVTTPGFLSVTTPGGLNIGGEGLTPSGLSEILTALLPSPPAVNVNVPAPTRVAPAPAAPPSPAQPAPKRYVPLSPTTIRALFSDYPTIFRGDSEYWVRGLLGTGIPGQTAARAYEWATSFWPAYARTGLPR